MILNPCHSNNNKYLKNVEVNWLGAASRRAFMSLLSKAHETITRSFLEKLLIGQQGLQGLHLGCGNGEDSFLITTVLDESSSLVAIDGDPVLINEAQQKTQLSKNINLQFKHCCLLDWSQAEWQENDFIYARFWISALPQLHHLIPQIHHHLKADGMLIIEVMQFSGYAAFPYNHAFSRASELIRLVEESKLINIEHWKNQLRSKGFNAIVSNFSPPGFMPSSIKGLMPLILESLATAILTQTKASRAELNALLLELKAYEMQQDILISRPGLHQIIAKKQLK